MSSKNNEHMPNESDLVIPHTFVVAGAGGGAKSSIVLRLLADELSERSIDYTPIDGIYREETSLHVKYPSLQVEDISEKIDQLPPERPVLFVAHCIGTVAAMRALEEHDSARPVGLVSISPPLPSPQATIMQPNSVNKRFEDNTRMRIVSLPEGATDYTEREEHVAHISEQYFEDIEAAHDLPERLHHNIEMGKAVLRAADADWNQASPATVRNWHADWQHSLPADRSQELLKRAPIVENATHGLYMPLASSSEESLRFQRQNVIDALDAGLTLLQDDE